ncbi:MAG TPA: glycosyltransferase family 2 protein [Aliidongia sp.]|nr:glycosyltransferase family 2 protein [Aliidongia sp.]
MSLVSVVIPTLNRPKLVVRALASVFAQTYPEIEVIVIVDGPDHETIAALRQIGDPRLQVIVNPRSLTAAGARNVGIDRAKGDWIAFLDDDDEWLPTKLARQMEVAADHGLAVISCLSRVVTPRDSFIRPKIIYDNAIPIDDYLFDRRWPFGPLSFVQTSSYLLPRAVFEKIRFRTDNPHDDWDLLLRLSKQLEVQVVTVPEVLAILYVEDGRPSLSKSGSWLASLLWIDSMRPMLTRRAYSGFCLSVVGPRAAKEREYRAIPLLLHRAFKYGSPRLWRVATFMGLWLVPHELFRRIRGVISP